MAWGIVYFATKEDGVPAEDFLDACPAKIEARFYAVLEAVRGAPPPQFSGGGGIGRRCTVTWAAFTRFALPAPDVWTSPGFDDT